jgi:arsenite methyltransferase
MTRPSTEPGAELFADDKAARALEAVYLTGDLIAQRDAVLRALAPRLGEAVADIGCGPGLLALEIAEAVGSQGRVLGVDASTAMVAIANRRCAPAGNVTVEVADAVRLPGGDGMFDALVCTQVLEYVPDVPAALQEFLRLLRPGGRLLLMDTDWESCVWHSTDRDRMRRMIDAWDSHCSHPQLPRTLVTMLADAGFAAPRVEVHALVTHTRNADTFARAMEETLSRHAVRTGQVDADTASAWRRDLESLDAEGRYFFSLNRYVFHARRP